MIDPSATAHNGDGRDALGRFARGNRAARGNPYARRVARLRAALLRAVTPVDIAEVIQALLAQAKAGDVASAKEVLQRVLGQPEALDLLARLEALEEHLLAQGGRR